MISARRLAISSADQNKGAMRALERPRIVGWSSTRMVSMAGGDVVALAADQDGLVADVVLHQQALAEHRAQPAGDAGRAHGLEVDDLEHRPQRGGHVGQRCGHGAPRARSRRCPRRP